MHVELRVRGVSRISGGRRRLLCLREERSVDLYCDGPTFFMAYISGVSI